MLQWVNPLRLRLLGSQEIKIDSWEVEDFEKSLAEQEKEKLSNLLLQNQTHFKKLLAPGIAKDSSSSILSLVSFAQRLDIDAFV